MCINATEWLLQKEERTETIFPSYNNGSTQNKYCTNKCLLAFRRIPKIMVELPRAHFESHQIFVTSWLNRLSTIDKIPISVPGRFGSLVKDIKIIQLLSGIAKIFYCFDIVQSLQKTLTPDSRSQVWPSQISDAALRGAKLSNHLLSTLQTITLLCV
ncbi:hypothetical protein J6590_054141 [Homalodisca vitripennis]|nr:hypothetical protein J6590_054141 [Homalodisca vitripennis]